MRRHRVLILCAGPRSGPFSSPFEFFLRQTSSWKVLVTRSERKWPESKRNQAETAQTPSLSENSGRYRQRTTVPLHHRHLPSPSASVVHRHCLRRHSIKRPVPRRESCSSPPSTYTAGGPLLPSGLVRIVSPPIDRLRPPLNPWKAQSTAGEVR